MNRFAVTAMACLILVAGCGTGEPTAEIVQPSVERIEDRADLYLITTADSDSITVDKVEFLTAYEGTCVDWSEEPSSTLPECGGSGFTIENSDPATQELQVAADLEVTLVDFNDASKQLVRSYLEFLADYQAESSMLPTGYYFITIEDNQAIEIIEKYLP